MLPSPPISAVDRDDLRKWTWEAYRCADISKGSVSYIYIPRLKSLAYLHFVRPEQYVDFEDGKGVPEIKLLAVVPLGNFRFVNLQAKATRLTKATILPHVIFGWFVYSRFQEIDSHAKTAIDSSRGIGNGRLTSAPAQTAETASVGL